MTRMELATWIAYGLIAIPLVAIPWLTHSFSFPDIAAWVLLVAAATLSAIWFRLGTFWGPEWLRPEDYDQFLKQIQRLPGEEAESSAPPKPPAPP
ncbi:MAG: hypothetical protein ACRENY_04275 [Candidatus Dormibacteria bacterium]